MRKVFIFSSLLFLGIVNYSYSQSVLNIIENFDGNSSFTATPPNSWIPDTNYYISSSTGGRSILGLVPNQLGSVTILETPPYDFSNKTFIQLKFKHICKISPQDTVLVQWKIGQQSIWHTIDARNYMGKAINYATTGFNAASYADWSADDLLAFPIQGWWKEEIFDMSFDLRGETAQFRFVIKRGQTQGTQASYGWLLEDFQITATTYELFPPKVEFIPPLVRGTVYNTGPHEINAKVRTTSTAPIETPWLEYTITEPGKQSVTNSLLMTNVSGDSLWRATIPQCVAGTTISYSILGRDTSGNEAMAISGCVIAKPQVSGQTGYVVVGTESIYGNNPPINLYYGYSWSRQLYLGTELSQTNTGGIISKLAWEYGYGSSWTYTNQTCYFKVVDDTYLSTNTYIDPVADGATLVWQGTIGATSVGWVEISLDNSFYLPPGKNLLIYWNHKNGSYYDSYEWKMTLSPNANMAAYGEGDDSWNSAIAESYYSSNRANARFYITADPSVNNSVAVHSLDIPDTIMVSPSTTCPVVAILKNIGSLNLDSVTVAYTVNNSAPVIQNIYYNPALAWDYTSRETLGYYTPKVNGFDTIMVWVSMPNGQNDSITRDDTLTKLVYGSSDILVEFVNPPADTVNTTGPYEIKAAISTLSGTLINSVSLYVACTFEGSTTYDTLPMTLDVSDNLWKVSIPHQRFSTDVSYSIHLADISGNNVALTKSYYIYRLPDFSLIDYVIVGTGTNQENNPPIDLYYEYSWSRQLYLGTELFPGNTGGTIMKLAWDYAHSDPWTYANQTCYFKAVNDADLTTDRYVNPVSDGATLVWQGTIQATGAGWVEIELDNPFQLAPGQNLMIYWHHKNGSYYGGSYTWNTTETSSPMAAYGAGDGDWNEAIGEYDYSDYRANARFFLKASGTEPNHSVILESINSPELVGMLASDVIPVHVTIRNKGLMDLDSCYLNWSLNGVVWPTTTVYKGQLAENFTDTITIGSYIPILDKRDTITVWVSMPNGQVDAMTQDDTLSVAPKGCGPLLSGTYDVKQGNTYQTLNDILTIIYNCGVAGDINIRLKGTYTGSVDLSNVSDYMRGHTLTITSYDNHPDSATIRVTSGTAITLKNSNNLVLKAITIDAKTATSSSYGIRFMEACTNVMIRDCKILTSPTATSTSVAPIYKGSGTGGADNISFVNNTLDGGNYGIYFYGPSENTYCTNIVFDSNTVSNQRNYGIYSEYTYFTTRHNTILSRTANTNATWYGMRRNTTNGDIIGNRVIQRSTGITQSAGIYNTSLNYYPASHIQGKALIANNEIILYTTSATNTYSGIYIASYSQADIINNSIYVDGTNGRGIFVASSSYTNLNIKNNNIVMKDSNAYPIYLGSASYLSQWICDYNNMYAPKYIGYVREGQETMAAWQARVTSDKNSIRVFPSFITTPSFTGTTSSLNLLTDAGLTSPMISPVTEDILGVSRFRITTMGCYSIQPVNGNARLSTIASLTDRGYVGQAENVNVVVYNTGTTTLDFINLEWSINGASKGSADYPVLLQMGDSTTITVGSITYSAADTIVKVWINNLNKDMLTDDVPEDDTISHKIRVCPGVYSGLLTIGEGKMFPDIESAYNTLDFCGVSGGIIFELQPGVYESVDLSNNSTVFGNHKLTIKSSTANVDDVTIHSSSGAAITMNNSNNIEIEGITIDAATSGTSGVLFVGNCTNIAINNCHILADTTATTNTYCPISKDSGGVVSNISITNNWLDGGYDGIRFYGGDTRTNYGSTFVLDSNRISNVYNNGVSIHYMDFVKISRNTILSRTTNTKENWCGLLAQYCNGQVIENRIIQRTDAIPAAYGIHLNNINKFNTNGRCLVANNEIMIYAENSPYYGMYVDSSNALIVNNSVSVRGSNAAQGIHIKDVATNSLTVQNNNIAVESNAGYPVYLSGTSHLSQWNFISNNYYAPQYVGYADRNISSLEIWKRTIGDMSAVSVEPVYKTLMLSLEVSNATTYLCPLHPDVQTDINGTLRFGLTPMGAYTLSPSDYESAYIEYDNWHNEVAENQVIPINVRLVNLSSIPVSTVVFERSLNKAMPVTYSFTFNPGLAAFTDTVITLGSYIVSPVDEVEVWLRSIDGNTNHPVKDSIYARSEIKPLVEFVAPFVADTLYGLTFGVNALIRTQSGAPVSSPVLDLTTIVNGTQTLISTVPMFLNADGIWQAAISQQYYASKVIYSLTVSDTINNTQTITDSTYLKHTNEKIDTVIIGTGTIGDYFAPINTHSSYSWTRQLYLGSEFSQSNTGGLITKLAWDYAHTDSWSQINQSCYFKAVDDVSLSSNLYIDPIADGATLVWQGSIGATNAGWVEINLDNPFLLPPGKNLLVYWNHQGGRYYSTSYVWNHTTTATNMTAYGSANNDWSGAIADYNNLSTARPNARFCTGGIVEGNNSVAMHTINLADTIAVRSGIPTPLYITIKNKGAATLTSATIYYSINGGNAIQYDWNSIPGLPWYFNSQVYLGDYSAKVHGTDTIKVWVQYPNGVNDPVTSDDTLTKAVYGIPSDYRLYFVDYVSDTIMTTGPFTVSAHVSTYSSTAAGAVTLEVKTTREGVTTPYSLSMQYDAGKGLYVAEIPQIQFNSHVVYSITKTDYLGNIVSIVDSFYIKRTTGNYVYVGDVLSTDENYAIPFETYYDYSWSRILVLASELNGTGTGATIKSIAFMPISYESTSDRDNQSLYFKAVSSTRITSRAWINPVTDGATLVWQGSISPPPVDEWMDIVLDASFILPPGMNLMIYWVNNDGEYDDGVIWKSEETAADMAAADYDDDDFPVGNGNYESYRPIMRFTMPGESLDEDNSVALESIESPLGGTIIAGQQIPVTVSLRNNGRNDLDSCQINWTHNGQLQTPVYIYKGKYNGKLWDGFSDTVTIGYFTSVVGQVNEIVVWVSLPNDIVDNVTSDDTLSVRAIACNGPLSGPYQVGPSGFFSNIGSALFMMQECGFSGKVTLMLEEGTYPETVDLSILNALATNTDTIEIVSLSGNAANTIIESTGFGIKLANINNVLIKDITIRLLGEGYGIQLGEVSNIEINGCNILLDTTATTNTYYPINKESGGIISNVRITNNWLDGGYDGIRFYGGTSSTNYGSNFVFDNNRISNVYNNGMNILYMDSVKISRNTVLSRTTNTKGSWRGMLVQFCNGPIIENRIIQRTDAIPSSYGIHLHYNNSYNAKGRCLVANNEIMIYAERSSYYGMYVNYSNALIVNNSISVRGSDTARGIHIEDVAMNILTLQNNNIAVESNTGHPVYLAGTSHLSQWNFISNNYYAPQYVGYAGGNISDLNIWKQMVGDISAVSVEPVYKTPMLSLEVSNAGSYICPLSPDVPMDINGASRFRLTPMGAYTTSSFDYEFAYIEYENWHNEVIENQTIPVNIRLTNLSSIPISTVVFERSLNKAAPVTYSYTFSPGLAAFADTVITLGSYIVSPVDEVEVWLRSVDGKTDHPVQDSIYARSEIKPLIEFVAPFVADTLYDLTFDVNALIRPQSGAPVTSPALDLTTIVNGTYTFTSTVPMTLNADGIWQATIPQQYYGSKVIYSLTVSDTVNNTETITDSTYLEHINEKIDTVIIGTGTAGSYYVPIEGYYGYNWSRQTYRYKEISPDDNQHGVTITELAWQYTHTKSVTYPNQTCYMRAVTDSTQNGGYIDPLSVGASQVWTGTLSIATGWVEITLNTPFFLPEGMHLEIFWSNQSNSIITNVNLWALTTLSYPAVAYGRSNSSFSAAISNTQSPLYTRPDIKLTTHRTSSPYQGDNLAVLSLVEPVNNVNDICMPDHTSVKIAVANLGENDYSFVQNPLQLGIEINDPVGHNYNLTDVISSGQLLSGETGTIEFMSTLPIMYSGVYNIKAWINSPVDNISYDDTLKTQFISGRIGLPVDEDFSTSSLPLEFVSLSVQGDAVWEPHTPDLNNPVQPVFGTGVLRLAGTQSTMSILSTRQLDLYRSANPRLEFWYYHDSTASGLDHSYTDVNIIMDGVSTTVLSLLRRGTPHGWTHYEVPLSQYVDAQCILVQFESMNKLGAESIQYIDRILVTSDQDLEVSEIIITPEISACSLKNKDVYVVIRTPRAQAIDFSPYQTSLLVDVPGNPTIEYPLTGRIVGSTSDTIKVASGINVPLGINNIRGYLTIPVDNYFSNDTAILPLDIRPVISVTAQAVSGGTTNCLSKGTPTQQKVTVRNTGNMEISGIELRLDVMVSPQQTLAKSVASLNPGDSTDILFDAYTVPDYADYQVQIIGYMDCDSVLVNSSTSVEECVDMDDLAITQILSPDPLDGGIDQVGSTKEIEVSLMNTSDITSYRNVDITALIEDENGRILASHVDVISLVNSLESNKVFKFNDKYTVPDEGVYYVRVFINSVDNYPQNDTALIVRTTANRLPTGENDVFAMGQNVPNPAKNSTIVGYSIPVSGEVVFNVHSISGQLLYATILHVEPGKHTIEINTSALSAGIYMYSMEYKGQRIVKRMSIKR